MSDTISFKTLQDTGDAGADSINPYKNGEPADAATLSRPIENLRKRAEVLRAEVNEARWVRDADRAVAMYLSDAADPATVLTWTGVATGTVTLTSGELIVVPSVSPGAARGESHEGQVGLHTTRFAKAVVAAGGLESILFTSKKFAYEGANQITVEVYAIDGSGAVTVTLTGYPTVDNPANQPWRSHVVVTYDPFAGHTVQSVINAIAVHPETGPLISTTFDGSDAASVPMFNVPQTALSGGLDGTFHSISVGALSAFFAADDANKLKEGDTLAVWYASPQLRRQSIEDTGEHIVGEDSLVNLSAEPEKAGNALVLGKVIQDTLVLANGTALAAGDGVNSLVPPSYSALAAVRDNAVLKAGDTMTGDLVMDTADIAVSGGEVRTNTLAPNSGSLISLSSDVQASGYLQATTHVQAPRVRSPGAGADVTNIIEATDSTGIGGTTFSVATVRAGAIQNTEVGGVIEVTDVAGDATTLGVAAVSTPLVSGVNAVRGTNAGLIDSAKVLIRDVNGDFGHVDASRVSADTLMGRNGGFVKVFEGATYTSGVVANNAPKGWARVDGTAAVPDILNGSGVFSQSVGIPNWNNGQAGAATVSHPGAGQYQITLANIGLFPKDGGIGTMCVLVTPLQSGGTGGARLATASVVGGAYSGGVPDSPPSVLINMYNAAGDLIDASFNVVVFYLHE